jgi:hypothetical protein
VKKKLKAIEYEFYYIIVLSYSEIKKGKEFIVSQFAKTKIM